MEKKRLLVVDDDPTNLMICEEILVDKYERSLVDGGQKAIEAYNRSLKDGKRYDLILLDIMMPNVNGIDVLTHIRKIEESLGISVEKGSPVIMVTAKRKEYVDTFHKGCDDYILKPFTEQHLLKKVEKWLHKND